jgi:hypothetical protein
MKRRGARDIPDFSPKHKGPPLEKDVRQATPAPPKAPRAKPQSTSAKSGRRGQ